MKIGGGASIRRGGPVDEMGNGCSGCMRCVAAIEASILEAQAYLEVRVLAS
jgi:hypothetical protein